MAGGPPSIEEELEISLAEELGHGGQGQNQEHLVIAEILERGSRTRGASHKRQKLEQKAAGTAAAQSVWSKREVLYKGLRLQMPTSRMLREQGRDDAHLQEYPGNFQGMRFHYERNPGADMMTDISLEEISGLEMEVMRKELYLITGRLNALEEQSATWRQREALFFTLLASACIANLWLWLRQ
ncbi:fetal and adult testis-expressed transcript protein [Carlito syrichta]|uniref:Fetal and adult testis-expressed transcript protein n=1 Tax=Carlito syrichta TaxID=1868482 RepID=A0A3Q0DSG5_CARSF|nr:fetal and adult testis-expressed transcript protein [Carlito syrichta]